MSRCLSSPVPVPPLENDDILKEILLRLPLQPSSLPRASLVSKSWRSIVVSDPQFLSRFRKHHRKQPLLGFFSGHVNETPIFTPALDSPDRIPAARFPVPHGRGPHEYWRFMGCRHGLAVLINDYQHEVIVWDPLTGRQHRVPFPLRFHNNERGSTWRWRATVLCADTKDGHVHGDCISSPFKLVLVCNGYMQSSMQSFACLYESVSGVWGNIVSTVTTHEIHLICPNILVGNALYWSLFAGDSLVFDTEKETLGVIQTPADARIADFRSFQLLRTSDDNGLGLAVISNLCIQLWKRTSQCDGVAGWVLLQKSIQLEGLFPPGERYIYKEVRVAGYDEDSNVIVLSTYLGDFMFQLDLTRFRTISERGDCWSNKIHYPYRNFYNAGRRVGWKWLEPNS